MAVKLRCGSPHDGQAVSHPSKGSRYADRLPFGKPEIIQNSNPDKVRKFYKDREHRPDLMAVVAVGDFNKTAVENLIKADFGSIPAVTSPRPRPEYDVPDHDGSVYAIATDKEVTSTSVSISNIMPSHKQGTYGVYRQEPRSGTLLEHAFLTPGRDRPETRRAVLSPRVRTVDHSSHPKKMKRISMPGSRKTGLKRVWTHS